jgi:LPXTG-site transpeptidase (sortase) family protein
MNYHEEKYSKREFFKFFLYFFLISLATFAFLYLFGLVPSSLKDNIAKYPQAKIQESFTGFIPTRIVIAKIGVDSLVYNPNSSDIKVLNEYISYGAVRYPGSGLIGKGNMFIFGHSADIYSVVNNQAYKTFNGIKKLVAGDQIKVFSDKDVYIYKVSSVSLVGADEAIIEFGGSDNKLTISTCNTFGAKEERQVVEAYYVGKLNI